MAWEVDLTPKPRMLYLIPKLRIVKIYLKTVNFHAQKTVIKNIGAIRAYENRGDKIWFDLIFVF